MSYPVVSGNFSSLGLSICFCDDATRKLWEIRNPRDLWSSKDIPSDWKKNYYFWMLKQVRCGKCGVFIFPRLKLNSACRSKVKCVVYVEFETWILCRPRWTEVYRSSECQEDSVTVWVLFPKSHGGVKHDLKAFPHFWHVCEYFKSCHDYFSTFFFPVSLIKKKKRNYGPGCLSWDDKKGGFFSSTYFGIYLSIIYSFHVE